MIIEYQQLDTEIDIQPETIPDNEKLKDMPLVFHQSIRIELREEDADFTDLKVVELLLIILSLLLGVLIGPQYILQFILKYIQKLSVSLEYVCEKYVDFITFIHPLINIMLKNIQIEFENDENYWIHLCHQFYIFTSWMDQFFFWPDILSQEMMVCRKGSKIFVIQSYFYCYYYKYITHTYFIKLKRCSIRFVIIKYKQIKHT
ncbi:hypothetical protein pb186bvf_013834 [Paramecium bursaria]